MRNAAISLVALTVTLAGAGLCQAEIAWEGKLREAHAKAKQQGKLMLLHFYSDNCVWCDRLEAGAFRSHSVVQSINDNFIPVKIHGTENPNLTKMFKVTKFPTDVIVTTDGKALAHSVSPQQPDRFIAMLTTARQTYLKGQTMLAGGKQPPRTATTPDVDSSAPEYATADPSASQVAAAQAAATQTAVAQAANAGGLGMPTQVPMTPEEDLPQQVQTPASGATGGGAAQVNQFAMPSAPLGGVPASLTGVRTEGMSLSEPGLAGNSDISQAEPVADDSADRDASAKPELAIEGYCAVSVIRDEQWVEGKPEFGVVHLGKLYLFANQQAMETFLADPVPYTPMLNEIDVVRFFEQKKIVPGRREWGVIDPVHNRMFFFADEAAMEHFEEHFERYLDAAIDVMDHAIEESNPGA
ncbi:DUF255 domain-containing protein [Roseiconus nitratireducens]|uniref:DUF255 domain-containing protein n=1 Tax=Roseiconus nitratireducens TaxID=2605748 RepID=A0A5M6DIL1_9BACT|nr:thioredoxin family protein [Roseiconus nitratireducens]KAA5547313.1 DUF255 domain-containing protein [Roseiconus nitratireducens]